MKNVILAISCALTLLVAPLAAALRARIRGYRFDELLDLVGSS